MVSFSYDICITHNPTYFKKFRSETLWSKNNLFHFRLFGLHHFKGTVGIISGNSPFIEWIVQFATVFFKPLFDDGLIRILTTEHLYWWPLALQTLSNMREIKIYYPEVPRYQNFEILKTLLGIEYSGSLTTLSSHCTLASIQFSGNLNTTYD